VAQFFAGFAAGADIAAFTHCAVAGECRVEGDAGAADSGGADPVCAAAVGCAGAPVWVLRECVVPHGESAGTWKHLLPEAVARGGTGVRAKLRGCGGGGPDEACWEVCERSAAAGGPAILPVGGQQRWQAGDACCSVYARRSVERWGSPTGYFESCGCGRGRVCRGCVPAAGVSQPGACDAAIAGEPGGFAGENLLAEFKPEIREVLVKLHLGFVRR